MLKRVFRMAFSLVFPPLCARCARLLDGDGYHGTCGACRAGVRELGPACRRCARPAEACGCPSHFQFDAASAWSAYEGAAKDLLHAFKFRRAREVGGFFGERLSAFAKASWPGAPFDAVVPVPLSRERRRDRGYNQSEILSRAVARELGLPHLPRALDRRGARLAQSRLGRGERVRNAAGCFRVHPGEKIGNGARILLVDDVLTTGATASDCARALKEAGAGSVTLLALARGL